MKLDDYQEFTRTTAIYKKSCPTRAEQLLYCVMGLANEAGEVLGKVKKRIRKGGLPALEPGSVVEWDKNGETQTETYDEFIKALSGEHGDVFYYLVQSLDVLGLSAEDVAAANQEKLESRKERGVLEGSGDTR